MTSISTIDRIIIQDISNLITAQLDALGLYYRIFWRVKTLSSIEIKINKKKSHYQETGKKMQDILGIRITVYFIDDEKIAIELIKSIFEEIKESHSIDRLDNEQFGPQRCNLVFRLPESMAKQSTLFSHPHIDTTFEVQFRTVFSEGWLEIEHDLRYKVQDDWAEETTLSRQLNGQFAVLQSSDWAMLKIFEEFAYSKYKKGEWSSFFRNIMRIRFVDRSFSSEVHNHIDRNKRIAKELLRVERQELLLPMKTLTTNIPLKMDSVLFIINRYLLNNSEIKELEPKLLGAILDASFLNKSQTSGHLHKKLTF